MNNIRKLKGSTLIEVLLYIAIVSVFLFAVTSIIYTLLDTTTKRRSIEEVNSEAQSILLFFQKEMRYAYSVTLPAKGISGNILRLITDNNEVHELSFDKGNLFIKINTEEAVQINSPEVAIYDYKFINANNDNITGSVLFKFKLKNNTLSPLQKFQYYQEYETNYSIKKYIGD